MNDVDGMHATFAFLGDVNGDLEFFHELFDDLPGDESSSAGEVTSSDDVSFPASASTTRSDRRRQRWLAMEDASAASVPLGSCSWRQIAKQQKQEREAAEHENAELRKLVDAHARASDKMLKLVQKAAALATREVVASPIAAASTPYFGPPADLEKITKELNALAVQADAMLTSSALATTTGNGFALENQIAQTSTGDAFETVVEVAWVLPFDVEIIAKTLVAHAYRLVTRKNHRHIETVYDDGAFKVVQAVSRPKEKQGYEIAKHGQLSTRMELVRADGSRLVLMTAQGGLVVGSTMVVSIDGGGFILVSKVPGHDSESLGPLSRVRWYRKFQAQPRAEANLSPAERAKWIHAFTTKSRRKAEREVDKVTQAMENLLLSSSSKTEKES